MYNVCMNTFSHCARAVVEGGKYSTVRGGRGRCLSTGYTGPLYYLFYMPSPLLSSPLLYLHTVHTTTKREHKKERAGQATYIDTYIPRRRPPPPLLLLLLLAGQPMIMIYVEHILVLYCIYYSK